MDYKGMRAAALAAAVWVSAPAAAQVAEQAMGTEDSMPVAPAIVAATYTTPTQDEGGYQTPNRDLTPEETSWHVRVALNVAALGCRGADEAAITAAYNAMLSDHRVELTAASTGNEQVYRLKAGGAWQARYDDDMTRLYNFWSQTPAHDEFCAAAAELLRQSADVPSGGFPAFAAAALPRLEAPFTRFYAAYDGYRAALTAWQARHRPQLVIAAAAPATPVAAPVVLAAAPAAEVATDRP